MVRYVTLAESRKFLSLFVGLTVNLKVGMKDMPIPS